MAFPKIIQFPTWVLVRMGGSIPTIELIGHGELEKLKEKRIRLQKRYPYCSYAIYNFTE